MKAIFYATSTGNTEEVANKIKDNLDGFDLVDISRDGIQKMKDYDSLIIGTPTWGDGDLQDDWEDCFDELKEIDFTSKKVALFCLGDQDAYPDTFSDAMGIIYEVVNDNGGTIIGKTSIDGYEYEESKAQIDDEFVGLVIDEDNQSEFTEERINTWCNTIKNLI